MNMESSSTPISTPRPPTVMAAETTNDGGNEIGGIYQGVGQTISYWQGQLHAALTDWLDIAQQIHDILQNDVDRIKQDISTYKWVINEYNAMLNDAKNDTGTLVYNFGSQKVNQVKQLFGDLGIPFPPSNVKYSVVQTSQGYAYQVDCSNFGNLVNDLKNGLSAAVTSGYLFSELDKIGNQISELKQKQTEDMFKVMYCYQAVRLNEKTVSGVMKALTQIFNNMIKNVAT